MIDNYQYIVPLLKFDSKDDFYFLQILQRKKENDTINSNSRIIKNYYIKSIDYLQYYYKEIRQLCDFFNARASIRLNKRSFKQTILHTISATATLILMGDEIDGGFVHGYKIYDRVIGRHHNESKGSKKWIVDIDEIGEVVNHRWLNEVVNYIDKECMPDGIKFVTMFPSKTGYHIITNPFDVKQFKERYTDIEIHKDNPTNLYIP